MMVLVEVYGAHQVINAIYQRRSLLHIINSLAAKNLCDLLCCQIQKMEQCYEQPLKD